MNLVKRTTLLVVAALAMLAFSACNLLLETRGRPDRCGDSVVDHWEQCDGANLNGFTCAQVDQSVGDLSCYSDCTFNVSMCGGGENCGDGVQDAGEQCDGAELAGARCWDMGYLEGGELGCHTNCTFDVSNCVGPFSFCGNGELNDGEACDDGDLAFGCSDDCTVEAGWECDNTSAPSACTPICGDDLLAAGETCDGTRIAEGLDCESQGHYPGTLGCDAATCALDFTGCGGACGDEVIQIQLEECDGAGISGDCTNWGFASGGLECTACLLGFAGCTADVPVEPFFKVAVGGGHTCALRDDGLGGSDLYCWGKNDHGQCGVDSSGKFRPTPTLVAGIPEAVTAIAPGENHTCVLVATGQVYCWGDNQFGQLGDGSTTSSVVPVLVTLAEPAVVLAAGANHTCALVDEGGQTLVRCWGDNQHGQLGGLADPFSSTPVQPAPDACSALTAGHDHNCVVTADAPYGVLCWGRNDEGQVGTTPGPGVPIPTVVAGLTSDTFVSVVAGGRHTCAQVDEAGVWRLYCWGGNEYGQLGTGDTLPSVTPVHVAAITGNISLIAAARRNTCALMEVNDQLLCWGSNEFGQLGVGVAGDQWTPSEVVEPAMRTSIAFFSDHACVIAPDSAVEQ
ncbi:hypothetical protein KKD52_11605, partial [Myxococcota bacterium]|nr:hypothetical protein [Myxococcota bacterium]MBU1510999.1 hypothetical protein [Myxococcota bacterium]